MMPAPGATPSQAASLLRGQIVLGLAPIAGELPGLLLSTLRANGGGEGTLEIGAWHVAGDTLLPPQRPLRIADDELTDLVNLIDSASLVAVEVGQQLEPDECRVVGMAGNLAATALCTPAGKRIFSVTSLDAQQCCVIALDQLPALHQVLIQSLQGLSEMVLLAHEPAGGPIQ